MTRAGFIGLGSMGAPIARRLARCGFDVVGCDISPQMLEGFDEPGTAREADPFETARRSEQLGICVRTDAQLEALVDGGRLFAALGAGGVAILHSTVSPDLARRMEKLAAEHGAGFVDVGVSGGGPAAIEGKLSLFVGGTNEAVAKVRPWLEAIGSTISHLGPVGRGQEAKLLNNLISIANYGMSAAIVDVAMSMGFDRQQFIEALSGGSAASFALRVGPGFVTPREGRNTPGAFLDLHDLLKKDVGHCGELPSSEASARNALLASCETMLARLRRAAAEAAGKPVADPEDTVSRYFEAVRAKDIEAFMALFADGAVFTMPNGKRLEGKAAIRESQTMVFAAGSPYPTPLARYSGPEGIAVEIEARLPDGSSRHTVNLYRFDDTGLIRSLAVTMRSGG